MTEWKYHGNIPFKSDSTAFKCEPHGDRPCFSKGRCLPGDRCPCKDCIDYRIVERIRKSGNNCTISEVGKFLKYACLDEREKTIFYKCAHSNEYYQAGYFHYSRYIGYVNARCNNDTLSYQACGFTSQISAYNHTVQGFCGGYFCPSKTLRQRRYEFVECTGQGPSCRLRINYCYPSHEYGRTDHSYRKICDDQCDRQNCKDESNCNGYQYGLNCWSVRGKKVYVPVHRVCDKNQDCLDGSDEQDCTVNNNTDHTCAHSQTNLTVPIFNSTRCAGIDVSKSLFPYCRNYMDQTNCSDTDRIGGYCRINGIWSSVSKYVVCRRIEDLCDDDIQNACIFFKSPESSCIVHKHKMCDGTSDCSDGSDEFHSTCKMGTRKFKFECIRAFNHRHKSDIPLSWLLDGLIDCMNGEDEDKTRWTRCKGNTNQIELSASECENAFICPGINGVYVRFEQLCDEIESCEAGEENRICRIARDLPQINKTAKYNNGILDVCSGTQAPCEVKRVAIKSSVDIFGATNFKMVMVPTSKVNCRNIFGEHYLYISCMGLCIEKGATCPLDSMDWQVKHESA